MKKIILPALLFISINCFAEKYWVFFHEEPDKYKPSVTYEKTELLIAEYPLLEDVEIIYYSFFLHAISINCDYDKINLLENSGYFKKILPVKKLTSLHTTSSPPKISNIAQALNQMNAHTLLERGLTGKDIKIGIVDGGFRGAKNSPWLKHIFKSGKIIKCQSFFDKKDNCFDSQISDDHGTHVWEMIGGRKNKEQIGMATESIFYLAHTDHTGRENKIEEDNWIAAIEWFHSEGVRLVNSSLGYSIGFDDPAENYHKENINGKSVLSVAAQEAVNRGMIIVSAAGNDGTTNFKLVSVPADAEGVITVGATTFKHRMKASFSSEGSDFLPYLKPDISCFSLNGTSFSAPVLTGIIACLLEADPSLTVDSVKHLLNSSAHLYPYGNTYIGYGVPDINNFFKPQVVQKNQLTVEGSRYKLSSNSSFLVVFHKKDKNQVLFQQIEKLNKGQVVIKKPRNCNYTTIWNDGILLEIHWK